MRTLEGLLDLLLLQRHDEHRSVSVAKLFRAIRLEMHRNNLPGDTPVTSELLVRIQKHADRSNR